jgi:hypothetical protein
VNLETAFIPCPYCGQPFEAEVDISAGDQDYVEDCPVCCRPIEFRLHVGLDGTLESVRVARDDE